MRVAADTEMYKAISRRTRCSFRHILASRRPFQEVQNSIPCSIITLIKAQTRVCPSLFQSMPFPRLPTYVLPQPASAHYPR